MVQDNEARFYVEMERKQEEEEATKARVGFQVVDANNSPFSEASITVVGEGYDGGPKSPSSMGTTTWFENVPLPANFTIEATDYKTVEREVTESDLGSEKTV